MKHVRRFFLRLVSLFRPAAAETELAREITAHLQLLEDRFVAEGMSRTDARDAARRALGGVEQTKELQRDARTFGALAGWSTDLQLGIRMLAKYPGLTIAGGLTLAIAIGLGAAWYDFAGEMSGPTLPFPDGSRLVEIELRNSLRNDSEQRLLHDYAGWRGELRSFQEVGAFRTIDRNVHTGRAAPEQRRIAELTASAFRLPGILPILGRPLLNEDEQPGAALVAVIGYDVWQRWFAGRVEALGQTITVGGATATVVGVMPEGFAFPINHQLWLPLQVRPTDFGPLEGPAVGVAGRLRNGVDVAQAEAELTVLTNRQATASPATHRYLQPRVQYYGSESPGPYLGLALTYLPILAVLLVACINVGTLVYARTATREPEIATRFTLGASRARIVSQLFVEAFALVMTAGAIGIAAADRALTWGLAASFAGGIAGPPFWFEPGLRASTALFALGLGVLATAMLSLLPALKATGARTQTRLATSGGRSTLQFGRLWTTAMIAQVAITVFVLPPAFGIAQEALRDRAVRGAFPAERYVAIALDADRESANEGTAAATERATQIYAEFARAITRQPGVRSVTFSQGLPGLAADVRGALEVEGAIGEPADDDVWIDTVAAGYFETFGRRIVAGRAFHDGDRTGDARTVIVNEGFARMFTGGANPVGRRARHRSLDRATAEPWLEIVGVVEDMGLTPTDHGEAPYIFHPIAAGGLSPAMMVVHVDGDPAALIGRIQAMAGTLDPRLRIIEVATLTGLLQRADTPGLIAAAAIAVIVSLGLFLSASGIFALVSVTIARRTRELGIRTALGAGNRAMLGSIFVRVLGLVGSGVAAGNIAMAVLLKLVIGFDFDFVLSAVGLTSVVMLTAGLLACVEPALRVLRINPTDALRTV